ncbi:MAG: riboflavin synthase [Pseudomonadota bacterium]
MFTGLVEEIGEVLEAAPTETGYDLLIRAETVLDGVALGDSIAVEGVCLTVTGFDQTSFRVGLAPETRKRTALEALEAGSKVNLERSVLPTTRLGGHFVQGHVDGTGRIASLTPDEDALWVKIATDPALMKYIVVKGYVAIDGTSLTVVETGPDWFTVTLVAYTQQKITLPTKPVGAPVNLEVDVLAKYVEKLVAAKGDA